MIARSYWPFYRATLEDGTSLETQAADLVLLGVEVPAGRHVVTVSAAGNGAGATAVGSLALLVACGIFLARRPR